MEQAPADPRLEADVLSRILSAQSILYILPTERHLAEFIAAFLKSLPGVAASGVCIHNLPGPAGDFKEELCAQCSRARGLAPEGHYACGLARRGNIMVLPLQTADMTFGHLLLGLSGKKPFDVYSPYVINLGNVAAAILESRHREEQLKKVHEQLLHMEKLSSLGKLTGAIAHEFNNPIFGVRNLIDEVRDGLSDETARSLLSLAVKECDRMAALVGRLRDFYKPTSAQIQIVDLHKLIDDILLLNHKRLQESRIKLEKNYAPQIPQLTVIEDQIKQVIMNLVQNAEEAMPKEGGRITVTTEAAGVDVRVEIRDTGCGILPDHIDSIFEPFFTTKAAAKGAGLGLSVSYGIIKKHGGKIEVHSQAGKGAAFILTLPVKKVVHE